MCFSADVWGRVLGGPSRLIVITGLLCILDLWRVSEVGTMPHCRHRDERHSGTCLGVKCLLLDYSSVWKLEGNRLTSWIQHGSVVSSSTGPLLPATTRRLGEEFILHRLALVLVFCHAIASPPRSRLQAVEVVCGRACAPGPPCHTHTHHQDLPVTHTPPACLCLLLSPGARHSVRLVAAWHRAGRHGTIWKHGSYKQLA